MPIYQFQCPRCGNTLDKIRKVWDNRPVECEKHCDETSDAPVYMNRVLAVPSPMQWGCRKGF
jgi:putative FmdB family regulatory protein